MNSLVFKRTERNLQIYHKSPDFLLSDLLLLISEDLLKLSKI